MYNIHGICIHLVILLLMRAKHRRKAQFRVFKLCTQTNTGARSKMHEVTNTHEMLNSKSNQKKKKLNQSINRNGKKVCVVVFFYFWCGGMLTVVKVRNFGWRKRMSRREKEREREIYMVLIFCHKALLCTIRIRIPHIKFEMVSYARDKRH